MKKPLIAILPLIDTEKESYWMLPGYMDGILAGGGVPVMLPLTKDPVILSDFAHLYDGFLFPGGHDVSPYLYGMPASSHCGETLPDLDEMSRILFANILDLDKPVLGICRGLQLLNVLLGGTLYQDLPAERGSDVDHHMEGGPYDRVIHDVHLREDSPLYALLQKETLGVNSYHHQGIRHLAAPLKVMAKAADGLVEAVHMPQKSFVWAVQWHPEFSFKTDENSRAIFRAFVNACE